MNIKKIEIDIVERNLEFVGDNVYQSSGVTGGIVHQGILRIFAENGMKVIALLELIEVII